MSHPKLLDLFSGQGGAGRGYRDAGFDVLGVDWAAQPRYPYAFLQGDCLALDARFLDYFDAIHASPPCQAHSAMKTMHNAKQHPDLVEPTRAMLAAWAARKIAGGKPGPWIMENVVGAPLLDPVTLCGTMFGLGVRDAELRRHRLFETNWPVGLMPQCQHGHRAATIGVYGGHVRNRKRAEVIGVYGNDARGSMNSRDARKNRGLADFTLADGREAMGIDWMTQEGLSQSIPPAYTRFLGARLIAHLHQAHHFGEPL